MTTEILSAEQTYCLTNSRSMSRALYEGAMRELRLTPKPGLVDRLDNGSHPDLSYNIMQRSASLLPMYYDDLAEACYQGRGLDEYRRIGLKAEKRMLDECGSNTHKGYIFMSGLVLLSSIMYRDLRQGVKELATEFLEMPVAGTKGADARKKCGIGGILTECLKGLPTVFEAGLPAMAAKPQDEGFYALACIMERAEDTTAVSRLGAEGLKTINEDGKELKNLIECRGHHMAWLTEKNIRYVQTGLTMGGCADLLAICYALNFAGYGSLSL